jgi:hypothetical protein
MALNKLDNGKPKQYFRSFFLSHINQIFSYYMEILINKLTKNKIQF